ncbi:caspase-3-like isoform X1 [Amphiura filiformis]|uniref:caspase-3-like isoform X1 n=1 Tax=Amphiura filiformis TaxID=82378 RepID=UPI003B219582
MDKNHKKILRTNRVRLVEDLQAEWVYEHLVGANIYEPWQIEEFQAKPTKRAQNSAILTSIETRGPLAFGAFIAALRSSNQGHLAELLDNSGSYQSPPFTGSGQQVISENKGVITSPTGETPMETEGIAQVWPNPETPVSFTNVKIEPTVMSTADVDVDHVYQMQSKPRGLAYIINNKHFRTMKTRQGTDVDKRNLEAVFQQLGFNVDTHEDLRAGQMKHNLKELARSNHSTFDCLVVAILSHGIEGGILGIDEGLVRIEDIINPFSGQNCPTMAGKPKLFFLQACRGERFDSGVEATDSTDAAVVNNEESMNQPDRQEDVPPVNDSGDSIVNPEEEAQRLLTLEFEATDSWRARSKLPNQSDMLLAFATVPGYVSWRNSERGSWFVQALCETLVEFSRKEDLLSIMTMVNNKVAKAFESSTGKHKQMPAPVTMLRKKLFFFPGLYGGRTAQPTS